MPNHILHSIKHIEYEVIQHNIILFNFIKSTRGYTIIIMSIMCLVLKWFGVVNSNDKRNSAYIFSQLLSIYLILRGIYCGLTLEYNHDISSPHLKC